MPSTRNVLPKMLLSVKDLRTHFRVGRKKIARAVDGISFTLEQGETLALVGESGCGKSQTAFSMMRLIEANGFHPSGEIWLDGENLIPKSDQEMQRIRGRKISMIFQEPMTSLNPLYTVGNQLVEPLVLHRSLNKKKATQEAASLLEQVGISDPELRLLAYPHELSGGMKQRVMIAMALACEPKLLIADEPTTALDVTIQAQILKLIADLQKKKGMAVLLITHDLGIVNQVADKICIMYAGHVVEAGTRQQIFEQPSHPYTISLFESIPEPKHADHLLNTIPGMVASATEYTQGCRFADRCQFTMDRCREEMSPAHEVASGHQVNCHLLESVDALSVAKAVDLVPAPQRELGQKSILRIQDLKTYFPIRRGVLGHVHSHIRAVDGVSLDVKAGTTLALVGESGCGKTTLGESVLRLVSEATGGLHYNDIDLMKLKKQELKQIRKELQVVFQDPYGSLSPRMTVEEIVGEGIKIFQPEMDLKEQREKIDSVLKEVGLDPVVADRFPHEFSGGQRQRICIARALVLKPKLLVLDEPTSALDVSVQAQVLNLLKDLQAKYNLTYLFITHDLGVVRCMADTIAIMYLGRVVEYGTVNDIFSSPKHPYTQALMRAVPNPKERSELQVLEGDVPSPRNPPPGCYFHPRCPVYLKEPDGSPLKSKCNCQYPDKAGDESYVHCHAA